MTLSSAELKKANAYNLRASKRHWKHKDLPEQWSVLEIGSDEFALVTCEFQKEQGLKPDGWLGPKTYNRIRTLAENDPTVTAMGDSYGWRNSFDQMIIHPTDGSLDGWDDVLSICDHHIWSARDPDLKTDKVRKVEDMVAGVLHTTGYGPGVERLDKKHGDDLVAIDEDYAYRLAEILKYKGDFFIGRTGYLCMMSPLKFRTYHSVSAFVDIYKKPDWPKTKKVKKGKNWVKVNVEKWPTIWPDLQSPLEMPGFAKRNINKHTWSIDLLAPRPGETYSDEQYETAARLIYHVHVTYGIPIDRYHINGHSDINPLDRSNPGQGMWDPGERWDWGRVFDRIEEIRG